jgi:hypothetical protein
VPALEQRSDPQSGMMGWIPHSSTFYQTCVGSYCYIPSCQAHKTAASQGQERAMFICCREPLGMFDRGPMSLPWVIERGRRGRHVVKSYPPVLIVGWRGDGVDCSRD